MPVVYDKLLTLMKERCYTTYAMRLDHTIHPDTYKRMKQRSGGLSWEVMNRVCEMFQVQPGDICEYISDEECKRRNDADKAEAVRKAAEKDSKKMP